MTVEYRKLTESDLDIFMEMRMSQLQEEGAKATFDLKPGEIGLLSSMYVMKEYRGSSKERIHGRRFRQQGGCFGVEKTGKCKRLSIPGLWCE